MAQKLQTELSLIEWCDQQVEEGKELAMGWEGGGDSGWCWFEIDGQQIPDSRQHDHIERLLNAMYDQLNYGSWAGEFSANGRAIYDPTEKAFVGTDHYSEDDTVYYECNIPIRIPKKLWFDRMEINIEDDEIIVDAAFTVRNGFLTEEHEEFLEEFKQSFENEVEKVVAEFRSKEDSTEFRSIWQNWDLERNEFREEGEFLVYDVPELNIGTYDSEEKDIYLELEEANTENYDEE